MKLAFSFLRQWAQRALAELVGYVSLVLHHDMASICLEMGYANQIAKKKWLFEEW